jgi:hypothetical protein
MALITDTTDALVSEISIPDSFFACDRTSVAVVMLSKTQLNVKISVKRMIKTFEILKFLK